MRLYGKKFLRNRMDQANEARTETQDAICWDVLPSNRVARVKIQGSNTLIEAHYPLNWETTPSWLKPGNSVRIIHTGGLRGRIELAGHGTFVPTPVSGAASPTLPEANDAILSGLQVLSLQESMVVTVTTGSFRINGTTYIKSVTTDKTIDPAPTGNNYRYDLLVIGADLTIDYVKGTASSNPVVPDVPVDHLECGRVLVAPGVTQIDQAWINRPFETPYAASIYITPASSTLTWSTLTTDVQVGVKDQYGGPIDPTTTWNFTVDWILGNGALGAIHSPTQYTNNAADDHFHVTYTRDQLPTDVSPMLKASLVVSGKTFEAYATITLEDANGNPMNGGSTGEQNNIMVHCDGDVYYNAATGVLTWTGTLHILFNNSAGMATHNSIAAGNITLSDNEFAYATLSETNDASISMAKAAVTTGVASNFRTVLVFGYRNTASDRFYPVYLRNVQEDIITLTSAASVTVNWNKGKVQKITLDQNVDFTFSGGKDGDRLIFRLKQDATGNRVPTWPAKVRFGTDITGITLSTDANKQDYLGFVYDSVADKYDVVSKANGY